VSKKQTNELEQIFGREALTALQRPYAAPCAQLQLFDGFEEQKAERKGKQKWNFQDEMLAQFLARGYSQTEAYRLSHPEAKTQNLKTLYPNASRACKRSNIVARVEHIRKELEERALMSTTEYFSILNEMARGSSKDGGKAAALKMIGQIKGVFQAEKGLPGSPSAPIVVRFEGEEPEEAPRAKEKARDSGRDGFNGKCGGENK